MPRYIYETANSWIDLNPEYEYRLFNDDDIYNFIKIEFPEYLHAYNKIKFGATKADFWRYLIIYKYGGVYADIDCECINPLREWINPHSEYVTHLGVNKDVCHWVIISTPGNPIFLKAAEKASLNILSGKSSCEYRGFKYINETLSFCNQDKIIKIKHPVLGLAGPPVLQEAAEECYENKSYSHIFESAQILCTSGEVSCQMNGNVKHDWANNKYLDALKQINTPHYTDHK